MSPERRPGDAGWKPSDDDVRAAERHEPGLALRMVSVIPFMMIGALGAIAFLTWLAVIVFGLGTGVTVWHWAAELVGQIVVQVVLAVLIGVACVAVVALSMYATGWGFRAHQPRFFWPIAQTVFVSFAIVLVVGRLEAPGVAHDIGLEGTQLYFALGLAVFAMIVTGMRMRRAGDDRGVGERHDESEGDHG